MRSWYIYLLLTSVMACKVASESPLESIACFPEPEFLINHNAREALDSVIDKAVREGLVGGTALIISEWNGQYQRAFGAADISTAKISNTCQKYRVASITKMFTAVATLLLVEEGTISLETKVGLYLDTPLISGISGIDQVTIEQLLNHTSGIPNYDNDPRFAPLILNKPGRHISLEKKLSLVSGKDRLPDWVIRKLGQIYSNTNYLILQLIIEKATGKSYEQFVKENVILPLELADTSFGSENPYPEGLATGYVDFYGNGVMRDVNEWDAYRFDAEGDLISTAQDLAIFYESLLTGRLLSDSLLNKMKYKRLGLLQQEFELENALGHDGIAIGFSAEMWYLRRSRLMIILLANQGRLVGENQSVLRYENLLRELITLSK